MKSAITTTLSKQYATFLSVEAKLEGVPQNAILERALRLYKKWKLMHAVREGLRDRSEEYAAVAGEFDGLNRIRLADL